MKPSKEELKHYHKLGLTMFEISQLHFCGYSSIQALAKKYEIIFKIFRIYDQDDLNFRISFLMKKGFNLQQAKRMTDKKIQPVKEQQSLKRFIGFDQIGNIDYIVKSNPIITKSWKQGVFDNVQIRQPI